ncbi:MAG: hypothetical protein QXG00_03485 [Candidatus Woesearchaeota archaeon]
MKNYEGIGKKKKAKIEKEIFYIIKKEILYFFLLLIILVIAFKIIYFKENLIELFKITLGLFWLFIIPGYAIMLYWAKNLEFLERLIIGSIASMALIGTLSYFSGLFGLHLIYHGFVFPALFIILGILLALTR